MKKFITLPALFLAGTVLAGGFDSASVQAPIATNGLAQTVTSFALPVSGMLEGIMLKYASGSTGNVTVASNVGTLLTVTSTTGTSYYPIRRTTYNTSTAVDNAGTNSLARIALYNEKPSVTTTNNAVSGASVEVILIMEK